MEENILGTKEENPSQMNRNGPFLSSRTFNN